MTPRVTCRDCSWSDEYDSLLEASEDADDHEAKEQHRVTIERVATDGGATRKHFYLITEHPDDEKEGLLKITDSRIEMGKKNEERTLHALPEGWDEFDDRFEYKAVGLGYVDFESESDYDERVGEEVERKLREIDEEHFTNAGLDPEDVFDDHSSDEQEVATDGGRDYAWIVTCPHDERIVVEDDLEAAVLDGQGIYDVTIASWSDDVEAQPIATDGGEPSLEELLQDVDGIGAGIAETVAEEFDGREELRDVVADLPPGYSPSRLSKLDGFGPTSARNVANAIDESGVLGDDQEAEIMTDGGQVSADELAAEIEAELCSRLWEADRDAIVFKGGRLAEELDVPVGQFSNGLAALREREDARVEIERWVGENPGKPWEARLADQRVAADGGTDVPSPVDWAYPAVVHGADVDADCLALTNAGDPCTYNAYDSNDLPVCNTHADVDDPHLVEDGHQWARIKDGTDYVTVCVNCQDVWSGREPETAVDCPTCQADAGERCKRETSGAGIAAPIPPHPDRRKVAYDCVPELELCDSNPAVDEEQTVLPDGGAAPGGAAVPPGANVDEAPWDWQVRSRTARNLYDDAMREWGERAQIAKASEECSELAAVLARDLNGQANVAELLQEIVDVRIMLEQLARTIGLGQDDLEAEVTTRLQQLDVRLRGGEDGD